MSSTLQMLANRGLVSCKQARTRASAHAITPPRALFYKSDIPLTGTELKGILRERPVRLSICGNAVTMRVGHVAEPMPECTYAHLAGLLNDWCATAVVRDTLQEAVRDTHADATVSLLLSIENDCEKDIYHA